MIRFRVFIPLAAIVAAAYFCMPSSRAAGVYESGIAPTSLGPGPDKSAPIVHGRRIIEFLEPPIQTEIVPPQPPPSVTFRSDPTLRAEYPPNPDAKTVEKAFHQEFGRLVNFRFELSGPSEEDLIRQSTAQALMSLAGRVYFDGNILLARDLLPNYFEQYGDRFVRSVEVSNRRVEGGLKRFTLSLNIDQDVLLDDLQEKRFIQRPQIRPLFFVFLKQTVNGAPDTDRQRARRGLEDVIADRNQRYAETGVPSMADPDVDISVSPEAFLQGRQAAQRNGVEVAMSGEIITRPSDLTDFISQEDWNGNTLTVPVNINGLEEAVSARLPLASLLQSLDDSLKARQAQGLREWWDIGSVEIEAPVDAMQLTDEQRERLEANGGSPKAIVPAERLGLRRNYYSPHFFSVSRLKLKLVRIDNGEILAETFVESASSAGDLEAATQLSINAVVNEAANHLIDRYLEIWPKLILDKSDFRILANNVSEEALEELAEVIRDSDPKAEVNIRSLLGNVGVLTVMHPGGSGGLWQLIERLESPRFRVKSAEGDAIEIERI